MRQEFKLVEMNKRDGDLIFTGWPELGKYHLHEDVLWINEFDKEEAKLAKERIWFVIEETTKETPYLNEWIDENTTLITLLPLSLPGKNLNIQIFLHNP